MTKHSTTKRTELAHRTSNGLDVALVWINGGGEDRTVVTVRDSRDGSSFEIPAERHLALDVYNHPFAYLDDASPMAVVATYPTRLEAELAQMVLWAAGIPYVIDADDSGASPSDTTRGVRLLVEQRDAGDARSGLTGPRATSKERL